MGPAIITGYVLSWFSRFYDGLDSPLFKYEREEETLAEKRP